MLEPGEIKEEKIWLFHDDCPEKPELAYMKGNKISQLGYDALKEQLERRLRFKRNIRSLSKKEFFEKLVLALGTSFLKEWKKTLTRRQSCNELVLSLDDGRGELSSQELELIKRLIAEELERLHERVEECRLRLKIHVALLFEELTGNKMELKEVEELIRLWNIYLEWDLEDMKNLSVQLFAKSTGLDSCVFSD